MPPEEHAALVAELFKSASELPPADRPSFLHNRCGLNTELRSEVESLLRTQQRAGRFMERQALDVAAKDFADASAFAAGEVVGDYEIISLIGKGGMGEVYLARDHRLQRNVALKLVRRGMDTKEIVRRFQHEQRLLAGLNHPNIAQLHGAGLTENGIPFFVMEHIEGTRIDEYCDANALTLRALLELFSKVCGAVHHAHQHLVVHRDLKPSNILVTSEGEPKLLDFGIAKALDAATNAPLEQTITLQNLMTPEYASPEHVRGESITTASDVYSLGVLLYELLTGSKPYVITTRTPLEIARIVTDQQPARPSEAATKSKLENRTSKMLKGDLDNIVLMAMRKEPERRYSSAAQLSGDIRRHLDGLPVTARKDTLAYRSSKFVRRNRIGVAAGGLVLVAIIAGLVVALWQAEQARAQRDLARREKSKAERLNQFLQTMLSFSNQSITSVSPVANRREVTVNEMLDQIAPRIETELADAPDVRAQVLHTLGSAYASQGRYDQAEKHLRAALDTQTRLLGENSAETMATTLELGVLAFRQLNFDEAKRLLEKAVTFYRSRHNTADQSPAKLATALQYLGDVCGNLGDTKTCLKLLNEALEISSRANLRGNERVVSTMNKGDLATALVFFGELDKGVPLLLEAIAEYQQISSEPRWELGVLLTALGVAELNKNRVEEAQKHLLESERILRRALGDRNVYLVKTLEAAAAVSYLRNDPKAAEEKARESLAIAQALPPNELAAAGPLSSLADILAVTGQARESEERYRQSLALHERLAIKNYLAIVPLKIRLGQLLVAQNRAADAEPLALAARDEARQHLGEESPITKAATSHLIAVYEMQGKHDLAAALKVP